MEDGRALITSHPFTPKPGVDWVVEQHLENDPAYRGILLCDACGEPADLHEGQ